jgi:hypothetical protein
MRWNRSVMMKGMPRLRMLVAAVIAIVAAVLLVMLAWFLAAQGLDRAAAWSNILALPVGVVGLAIGALGLRSARPDSVGSALPPRGEPFSGSGVSIQRGAAGRDQFNVAGGTVNITNRDR